MLSAKEVLCGLGHLWRGRIFVGGFRDAQFLGRSRRAGPAFPAARSLRRWSSGRSWCGCSRGRSWQVGQIKDAKSEMIGVSGAATIFAVTLRKAPDGGVLTLCQRLVFSKKQITENCTGAALGAL